MRGAQLAADVADVHVDGLLLDRAFLVPCDLEQLALREHLARTSHEGFEDVELKAREAHGFFPHRKRAGVDVERPVFVAHRGCGGGFGEALVGRRAGRGCAANVGVAQLHLHASQQLVEVEGLGQVLYRKANAGTRISRAATARTLFSLQAQTAKPAVKRALPWKRPKTAMSPTYAHFRQASLRLLRASS